MIMPFGKYKGWRLEDIPLNYLLWLSEDANLLPRITLEVESVLQERFEERDAQGAKLLSAEDRNRLVVLGPDDIAQWWNYYAKVFKSVFFGRSLKKPVFKVERSRRWMGYWAPGERTICICNNYILPQERFENILTHEMCHQYISEAEILDTSMHGKRWRNIAAQISYATKNIITICDDSLYAPNKYFRPGELVILPPKPEGSASKKIQGTLQSVKSIEAGYEGFEEELSNI